MNCIFREIQGGILLSTLYKNLNRKQISFSSSIHSFQTQLQQKFKADSASLAGCFLCASGKHYTYQMHLFFKVILCRV